MFKMYKARCFQHKPLLVGGFNPFENIIQSNWIISQNRGENTKYVKPPPSLQMISFSFNTSLDSAVLMLIFDAREAFGKGKGAINLEATGNWEELQEALNDILDGHVWIKSLKNKGKNIVALQFLNENTVLGAGGILQLYICWSVVYVMFCLFHVNNQGSNCSWQFGPEVQQIAQWVHGPSVRIQEDPLQWTTNGSQFLKSSACGVHGENLLYLHYKGSMH